MKREKKKNVGMVWDFNNGCLRGHCSKLRLSDSLVSEVRLVSVSLKHVALEVIIQSEMNDIEEMNSWKVEIEFINCRGQLVWCTHG